MKLSGIIKHPIFRWTILLGGFFFLLLGRENYQIARELPESSGLGGYVKIIDALFKLFLGFLLVGFAVYFFKKSKKA